MIKSYIIRLKPTEEQERLLWLHVDAMRFVWNWGLGLNMERFRQGEKRLFKENLGTILTELRKTDESFYWLNEVSVCTLKEALSDLDDAYARFFRIQKKEKKYTDKKTKKFQRKGKKLTFYEMNGHPKFKSRHDAEPKFYARYNNLYLTQNSANVEKVGKVAYQTNYDDLPIVTAKRENTTKYINPRIKYVNGKWILSFGIERESAKTELNSFSVGIDLGVKELAVISYDGGKTEKIKNINKTKRVKKLKKRLKRKQRNVSRKYHTNGDYTKTAGILKEQKKVAKLHRKLANIRHDYTHQKTTEIIRMNPKKICIEDLNVAGMMKNKHLSEAIAEQTLSEFRRQIEYKAERARIAIVHADRFFPSSKMCSCCGNIKKDLKLKNRVYECEVCGLSIDRDVNAAINLEKLAV